MQQPTPGLTLEYTPCPGGARLVRLYGDTPCPVLPPLVDGLPLVALGPYCFADPQRESAVAPPDQCLRAETPGAPPSAHRICGSFLVGAVLPDCLRLLGDCAFYNCRSLAWLSFGSAADSFGSDVFLNTFALHTLLLRAAPDAPSSLYRLLANLQSDVRALFVPDGKILAAARYPEFWEDIEETPAHILLHTYSGQGYHYRQCFAETVPRWAEYDAVFPQSRAEDPPAVMSLLCLDRLRWPFALDASAAAAYRAFLAARGGVCLAALLAADDTEALDALLAMDILDADTLAQGAAAAAKAENAAFAARLTNRLQQKQAAQAPPPTDRYTFDF